MHKSEAPLREGRLTTIEKIRNYGKWWNIPVIALLFVVSILFAVHFKDFNLQALLAKYEKIGLLICLLSYILLGITVVPSDPVTLIVLSWKGPWYALIIAAAGNTAAALVEFYIGGTIGDLSEFEAKKSKLPFHLGNLPMNSPWFLLLARMIPGFGSKFVSLVGGVYQVPIATYLWTTIVANLIGAGIIVSGGYGLLHTIGLK